MMTSSLCTEKAELCEARASACIGTAHAEDWRRMAVQWRSLAGDGTAHATLARLMSEGHRT
jgi:hypothetical protein